MGVGGVGVVEPYVCTIPAVPLSLNVYTRMHWSKQAKAREAFQEQVWGEINRVGNRCPRGLEFIDCKAVLTFTENRRRDGENFGAVLWKWTADILVSEGVVPDDTPDHILCHTPGIVVGVMEQTLLLLSEKTARGQE